MTEFETTLDRDVRFTPEQITFVQFALRGEITKRKRSIAKAEAAIQAGHRVQTNVLDEHYRAVKACEQVRENLRVAERQIAHRIAARAQSRHDMTERALDSFLGKPGTVTRIDVDV